jgi:Flp pilus assembly protein TadD
MEKFQNACDDAYIATQLDPKYAKAWARLGIAQLKLGNWKKARDAYQRAIDVTGGEATNLMTQ